MTLQTSQATLTARSSARTLVLGVLLVHVGRQHAVVVEVVEAVALLWADLSCTAYATIISYATSQVYSCIASQQARTLVLGALLVDVGRQHAVVMEVVEVVALLWADCNRLQPLDHAPANVPRDDHAHLCKTGARQCTAFGYCTDEGAQWHTAAMLRLGRSRQAAIFHGDRIQLQCLQGCLDSMQDLRLQESQCSCLVRRGFQCCIGLPGMPWARHAIPRTRTWDRVIPCGRGIKEGTQGNCSLT